MEELADPAMLGDHLQATVHRLDLVGIAGLVGHRQVVARVLFFVQDRGAVFGEDLDVTGAEIDALVERIPLKLGAILNFIVPLPLVGNFL